MNKNYIWALILIIILVLVAIMYWSIKGGNIKPPFALEEIHPLDQIKGNPESKVVVMEYSDFECGACRVYYLIMKELLVEFSNRVVFVYRHFPMTDIYRNSELAARAAEAAGRQGKFWEMHDLLFEKQNEWAEGDVEKLFQSYAALLSISIEQFEADWKSSEIKNLVRAHKKHALELKLLGTPTFFINGVQIENPKSVAEFKSLIREALNNNL
ncbi:MAG: thioredoxin domain-containing protein [Candidatus Zambryskibacteria bacterium]|nr:thioredoxin domain-containing protein [Candidatus Zambryskibacteria bacterium]